MSLFQHGDFTSHSGITLPFKITCEGLTERDYDCLARIGFKLLANLGMPRFNFIGIPTGGLKLAKALNYVAMNLHVHSIESPTIICDDVYTTGASMYEWLKKYNTWCGLVIFSRAHYMPSNVVAIFQLNKNVIG